MQKSRVRVAGITSSEERRRHRMRLLVVLAGICRKIERLQPAGEAGRACRQVAGSLRRLLEREKCRQGNGRGD